MTASQVFLLTQLVNTLIVGETGKGKTTLVLNEDLIPVVNARTHAVVVFCPHSALSGAPKGLAIRAAKYAAVFCPNRLIVDDLGNCDWISSPGPLERSRAEGRRRRKENEQISLEFAYALAMNRPDFDQRPNNRKYTILAIRAWLLTDLPLWYLPWVLRPPTDKKKKDTPYHRVKAQITDRKLLYELELLEDLPPARRFETVGGASRILDEAFDELSFQGRMEPTYDLYEALKQKKVICLMGLDADPATCTLMFRLMHLQIIRLVRNHYATTGTRLNVRVYVDEAANLKLYGMQEARSLAQLTSMGKTDCLIVQVPKFGDENVDYSVMSNTPRKITLRSSGVTSKIMADDMKSSLDPFRVHHSESTTKRQIAGFQSEEKISHRLDHDGQAEGSVRSHDRIPIYEDVVETRDHYFPLRDQELMTEAKIQGLEIGECVVNNGGKVFDHKFADWADPGQLKGYAERKLARRIEELKGLGILSPPFEVTYESWNEPQSDEKAPFNRRRKGMG